jgi:pyruvate dehydrogenase E1 component alpha subunit/2-oxoisovalerate dehydrogenase E1 component alpha subunit
LLDKAAGYGVQGRSIDGTDLAACLEGVGEAVAKARASHAPQIVVAQLLRLCGHGEHDDASYVELALKNSPVGRDCLKVAEACLLEQGWAEATELAAWRAAAVQKVEETVAQVQREPGPDPYREDWCALATPHLREGGTEP